MSSAVGVEVVLSPFDAEWDELAEAARRCEDLGIATVWTMDHLWGTMLDHGHALESFTTLAGLAAVTETCGLGVLVANTALRPVALLAQAAATVQHQSGGRLRLGIGAGGGSGTVWADELDAIGVPDATPGVKCERVAETLEVLTRVWNRTPGRWHGRHLSMVTGQGFLVPRPPPPVIVGGFGRRMAAIAGTSAAGFNTSADHPALADVAATARRAHAAAGRVDPFEVSAYADAATVLASDRRPDLAAAGVDVVMAMVRPPFDPWVLAELASLAAEAGGTGPGRRPDPAA